MVKPLVTQEYYSSTLYVEAVSANLDNTEFMGKVTCREHRENGRHKTLWVKRMGQKLRRKTKYEAMCDAYFWAEDQIRGASGAYVTIAILGAYTKGQ